MTNKQDVKQEQKHDTKHDHKDPSAQHKSPSTPEYKSDAELVAMMQRLQADFENFKKRVDKEKHQIMTSTTARVVSLFLPILDAFEMALKHDTSSSKEGMHMIQSELKKTLAALNVTTIHSVGKRLDPLQHEVLLQEERTDADDDVILEELQRGYKMGDYIIRTSKVKIAKRIQKSQTHDKEDKKSK